MARLAPSSTSLDLYLSIHPLLMGNKDSACVMIQKCEPFGPESESHIFVFCFCKNNYISFMFKMVTTSVFH